jgi:hypothetical protein
MVLQSSITSSLSCSSGTCVGARYEARGAYADEVDSHSDER